MKRLLHSWLVRGARTLWLCGLVLGGLSGRAATEGAAGGWAIFPAAQVDSEGIFLHQIAAPPAGESLPALRVAAAPAFGQALVLTRAQLQQLVAQAAPDLVVSNWSGTDRVRVTRRIRSLSEGDLKDLLTAALQRELVKDRGELELRLTRAWTALNVPDEPLQVRLLDVPASGLSPMFILRFELRTRQETLGTYQTSLQARVWREIWVAHSTLKRAQALNEADLVRERRDVLALRDGLAEFATPEGSLEIAESVMAGQALYARQIRVRPVMFRGQSAEAVVQEGMMNVVLRVEVLEDGAPGQIVRIRNPQSRRELRGKVQNDQTILVCL